MTSNLIFIGYIIVADGIKVDEDKIKAIKEWEIPQNIHDICNFHDLASFSKKFIKNFNSYHVPPLRNIMYKK